MEYLGCEVFGMLDFPDVECLDAGCLRCGYLGCGIFVGMCNVDSQNALKFDKYKRT